MGLIQAQAKVSEARKSLLEAKDDKSRKLAADAYAAAIEAATKYKKKTTEESEETDEAEEEESEDADKPDSGESSEEDSDAGKSSTGGSSTGSTKDTTEMEEKAQAALSAKTGLYTHSRLWRLAKQTAQAITGKSVLSVEEVFGAIDGAGAKMKEYGKLVARNEKLEGDKKTAKVNSLIKAALADGRISPAGEPYARTIGMRSPKELEGFLATQMKRRTLSEGELQPKNEAADATAPYIDSGHGARNPVQLGQFKPTNGAS